MGKEVILSPNAQAVAESRYFMEGEDWQECCKRIARTVSSVESDKKYFDLFYEMIYKRDFLPGRLSPQGFRSTCAVETKKGRGVERGRDGPASDAGGYISMEITS